MMRRISSIIIFTLSICFALANQSFANGVLRESMGPVSSGRGGTNIACTDNGVLVHDNPSALTQAEGKRAEADFDFLVVSTNYKDPDNHKDGKDARCFMPSLSYAQPIAQGRFGIGFGVYCPAGFSTEHNLVNDFYGRQKYASDASLTKILLGFGWKATDRLSLGIAGGPSYSKVKLETPYTFQTGPLAGVTGLLDLEADKWAFAWTLGAQWRISTDTTLGLSYRHQDKFHMSGEADVDTTGFPFPFVVTDRTAHYDVQFDFTWPQSLGLGIAHRIKDDHRISADVMWIDWSSAFDEVTFKLSDGDNAEFDALAGDSPQDTLPLEWKDSYAFRLGYEYFLTSDTFRLGYIYTKNPVPSSTLVPLIPAILEHLISFGYGHNWKSWTLDAGYQYTFGSRQSVETSKILGGDYDNSSVDVKAHVFTMGIQYRF